MPNAEQTAATRPASRGLSEKLPPWMTGFSLGSWIIFAMGVISAAVLFWPRTEHAAALSFWVFSREHEQMYVPIIEGWNDSGKPTIDMEHLGLAGIDQRMFNGFRGGLPTADVIEAEYRHAGRAFAGPIDAIGFTDLTEIIKAEGLDEGIASASFTPWTTRGHIFGLPHDVHPVLLAYRHDIAQEYGVDVSTIETWDDFAEAFRPVMEDRDGDGEPDHYPLAFWPWVDDKVELLLYQGGTGLFDGNGQANIATPENARVLATMVSWCVGPDRIAYDVRDFEDNGNKLKREGKAVAYFTPDWMCGVWKNQFPDMGGLLRIMPLPAMEPGGRRTSVWGGTMIGIPKTTDDFDEAWAFAKHLYLSPDLAEQLWERGDIVSPVKSLWDSPMYDEPDAYFSNQPKGRMYIDHISQVPARNPSPYNLAARRRVRDAALELLEYAQDNKVYERDALIPQAEIVLEGAHTYVQRLVDRNVFLKEGE
jgi:arabinosaccharide transport system substrate-binding protein